MGVKEHYDKHLGDFYIWMIGDFQIRQSEFHQFLKERKLIPASTAVAVDLGAGHGIQSTVLARLGYQVQALDFNRQLLAELQQNAAGLSINVYEDDLLHVKRFASGHPELILCWGDTILHLAGREEVKQLIGDCFETLGTGGKLVISFRDYTNALTGADRFIPVKSDDNRILTCCLDYEADKIQVTDILHFRTETGWQQKISSYYKMRILPEEMKTMLTAAGFDVEHEGLMNSMVTMIAVKC
jgi:2-polyprenyl-3-methyl-5-hydroxy-6-metoxy-1,4-benzoquinol methylase